MGTASRKTQKIAPNHQSRPSRGGGVREIVTAGAERAAADPPSGGLGLGTLWSRAQTDGFTVAVAQASAQIAMGGSAAAGGTGAVLQMDAMVLDVISFWGSRSMHVLVQKAAARRPLCACALGG